VVERGGSDLDEELVGRWSGLGDVVERERVVDLARLAFNF
jgi:hypothetical protein